MTAPRTQYTQSHGAFLAHQVLGDGPRDLVLALDWMSHLEVLWEQPLIVDFVTALTRFGRVLWFDMRGVGMSDRIPGHPVAPEEWIDDVVAVMDAAGSERATLIAQGHAAQMALMAAATHPNRVVSLVLYNGFARLSRADDYPPGLPPRIQDLALEAIRSNWGTGTLAHVLAPSSASLPGVQEWWGRAERFAGSPGMAVDKMRSIFDLDVRDVLPLVACPTLVVHSRDNAHIRVDHGRYLAQHLPDVRLVELDTADHSPMPNPQLLAAIEEFVTGAPARHEETDRFLATVFVVDVVGSTDRLSEVGDRGWAVIRDRFEHAVREALVPYGGEIVDTAGDGLLVTFDGPAKALRCARRVRDTVRRLGLEIRCGLHAGEVTRREGGIAGIAVHIAARVAALAAPGEILVTRTVRDLVAGSEMVFEKRGEHELKGVREHWALYAAVG